MNQDQLDYVVFKLWKTLSSFAANGPSFYQSQNQNQNLNPASQLNQFGINPSSYPFPLSDIPTQAPPPQLPHPSSVNPCLQPFQSFTSKSTSPFQSGSPLSDSTFQTPILPELGFLNSSPTDQTLQAAKLDSISDLQLDSYVNNLLIPTNSLKNIPSPFPLHQHQQQQQPLTPPFDIDLLLKSVQDTSSFSSPASTTTSNVPNPGPGQPAPDASSLPLPLPLAQSDVETNTTTSASFTQTQTPEVITPPQEQKKRKARSPKSDSKVTEIKQKYDNDFLSSLPPELALKRKRARSAKQTALIQKLLDSTNNPDSQSASSISLESQEGPVKRHRNTDAARRSRLRKALRMETLEQKVVVLQAENDSLREQIKDFVQQKARFEQLEANFKKEIAEITAKLNFSLPN
ncbi:hypothetical protein BB560_003699 [Smittium megazygosporum]|uniref:BZIP domain-containing protein n=1 Tax=Smittium megazygosporum TaxID=133381 RepID=A0A2T9ZBA6_9FUNG|nr:hypothetical protein BB560_003699 [Smittium megazygosporum]